MSDVLWGLSAFFGPGIVFGLGYWAGWTDHRDLKRQPRRVGDSERTGHR